MTITPAQAQKILAGSHTFTMLGFSMLITRLRGTYSKNNSQATLQNCVNEINAFLKKYSTLMSSDIAVISKL